MVPLRGKEVAHASTRVGLRCQRMSGGLSLSCGRTQPIRLWRILMIRRLVLATALAVWLLAPLPGGAPTPAEWTLGGNTPLDALQAALGAGAVQGAGAFAKLALAARTAGLDVRSFG